MTTKTLLLASALLAALASSAEAETWCLKSEHQAGSDGTITYYYRRGSGCPKEYRLIVEKDSFGRDAAMIEVTVAKKKGE
jgi:hypothetical protein